MSAERFTRRGRFCDVRSPVGLIVFIAVLAACASPAEPPTTPADSSTTTEATTTPPTTTTIPTITTTPAGPPPSEEPGLQTLDDGRPATFVAVTSDYEAVEVDTATGQVIRSLGQISTAEDVATAECAACINAIDAVWRTSDGSHHIISECCEPAAGRIHVLTADDLPLLPGTTTSETHAFWWAVPSPRSGLVAFLGYSLLVTEPGATPVHNGDLLDGWAVSNPTWSPDGSTVRWLQSSDDGAIVLRSLDLTSQTTTEVAVPALHGSDLADLTTRVSGELVALHRSLDGGGTTALVLTVDGAVVDEFDLEDGARLGGHDPSGSFLLYVTDDGAVRWRGENDSGVLAEGYLFASW
jgi:hypothetical protein